jgi:hypothetical protein
VTFPAAFRATSKSVRWFSSCWPTAGVALDDYSEHCWTATEIAQDLQHDGLRFFDYRTSFERRS